MAFADVEFVPFWYVVEAASSTVTFWPADVVIVKPEVDMLSTVPDAPPAAGPDRAFDARPPDPLPPAAKAPEPAAAPAAVALDGVVLDDVEEEDDEDEPPPQAASATTAINMAARTSVRTFFRFPRAGPRGTKESPSTPAPSTAGSAPSSSSSAPRSGMIVS
jgi:hypothetical protein